jgi:two-component system cell cycle sensor histidine kinase/response regulator CckA
MEQAQTMARVGSWERDLATGRTWWSNELYRILGLEQGKCEPSFEAWLSAVHPDDRATVHTAFQRGRETGEPFVCGEQERARLEGKLRQAGKMEAVGRLAGGVAHDFNNLLTVVLSYSDFVLRSLRPDDPLRAQITEIRGAGERAANLTRQLLAFSRQQVSSPRVISLNTVLAGVEPMLRRLLGEDIEVRTLPAQDLFLCKIDPGQVEQILMKEHPEASVGPHAVLAVTDTGVGMGPDVLAHLFEPFFTTKAMGLGTGLGLATVYGIVKQAGGCLWVYSEPGKGSTFKVYLPRVEGEEAQVSPPPDAFGDLRGTETVLLVEDEEGVRRVVHGILVQAGYHVIEASNGGEALLVCEQHGATIGLLLTDVVMPRLNGRKLAERLLQIRPDLKVLYMSGYTENAIVHHGVLDSGIQFLPKPITPDALLRKVREVLGPRRG